MRIANYRQVARPASVGERARKLARHALLSARSLAASTREGNSLRLLYGHYVFDNERRNFEKIIRYVKSVGRFVTTDEVLDVVQGRRPLQGNLFHLSFDDGFQNIIDNALPILCEHGVPAIFFVPTAVVEAGRDVKERFATETTGHSAYIEVAGWDELARAAEHGLEIGSHSRTHARLAAISDDAARLEDEIVGSKLDIERRLGRRCDYISWPYGRRADAGPAALKMVEAADYRGCFGAFRGQVRPSVTPRLEIPRHHFEAHWPLSHVKCFVHGAMEGEAA